MPDRFALLIGAMKAGTTGLYMALARHPEILACSEKEPEYWVRDELRREGLAGYRRLWSAERAPGARWLLEASTAYSQVPRLASPAIHLRNSGATFRFVYLVRDPVQRIRSQYEHALAAGWFARPIHEELHPVALWLSNYLRQLEPYVDCFGRESVLVLTHEELALDPAGTLARVWSFLDVDPVRAPRAVPRANEADRYRSIRLQRSLASSGLLPAELGERPVPALHPADLIERAGAAARARGCPELVAEAIARLERDVTPSPEQAAWIRSHLADDLHRFEEAWGIDPWTGRRHGARAGREHPTAA